VTAAGELWTWGNGFWACLGLGQMEYTVSSFRSPRRVGLAGAAGAAGAFAGALVFMVACGASHTVALTDSGVVWTCGTGTNGALGHGGLGTCFVPTRIEQARFGDIDIVSVAAGRFSSMTVTARGVLYSWGSGALGRGTMDERVMVPVAVAATLPPGSRVGQTCEIPPEHSLSFCMGVPSAAQNRRRSAHSTGTARTACIS